ncbi:thioredoxin domain-containing protein [Sphingobacterium sp. SRCM116780]|uniref:thioredoxin domain-containing protein n=1 Tax=Sphingobacterium sp. SRCM116780 TaxID=2907623 RepID=UPI001F39C047|nr:thioredoxin domain-containing protein [Sphingobacterium sp. SRCM116780]UIR54890.1 thioredoxin domain-containing protein [Sphingobacterium sp. SRCM116780]
MKKIGLYMLLFCTIMLSTNVRQAFAQGNKDEVLPYREENGYMIIRANVGGTEGDFLLDSRGAVALTEEAATDRAIKIDAVKGEYARTDDYQLAGKGTAQGFFIGKTVYKEKVNVMILKANALLQKLKVDGVIGFNAFTNSVLTINSHAKTITLSEPYKPAYMNLANRSDAKLTVGGLFVKINVNGKEIMALTDFYEDKPLILAATDFETVGTKSATVKLINQSFEKITVIKGTDKQQYSIIGKSLLNKGVISFDVQRSKYYFQPFGQGEEQVAPITKDASIVIVPGKVNSIDKTYFREHIYDYKQDKEWKFKGDKPVVIDFWATWCAPCMKLMPAMEALAAKYKDKVIFCKVNIDKEGELRQVFGINAIPLLYFAPVKGDVVKVLGLEDISKIEAQIQQLLK